jgi:hypothetical protein
MSDQVSSYPDQVWSEPFGADVVHTSGNDTQGVIHLRFIGPAPLPSPLLAFQTTIDQSDQAFAMQSSDRFHLIQQPSTLFAISLDVAPFNSMQMFKTIIDWHLVLRGHRSLR